MERLNPTAVFVLQRTRDNAASGVRVRSPGEQERESEAANRLTFSQKVGGKLA